MLSEEEEYVFAEDWRYVSTIGYARELLRLSLAGYHAERPFIQPIRAELATLSKDTETLRIVFCTIKSNHKIIVVAENFTMQK